MSGLTKNSVMKSVLRAANFIAQKGQTEVYER